MDTALVTGVDAGLWILMAKNGDGPQNVADLADTLGFDSVLLGELICLVGHYLTSAPHNSTETHII